MARKYMGPNNNLTVLLARLAIINIWYQESLKKHWRNKCTSV